MGYTARGSRPVLQVQRNPSSARLKISLYYCTIGPFPPPHRSAFLLSCSIRKTTLHVYAEFACLAAVCTLVSGLSRCTRAPPPVAHVSRGCIMYRLMFDSQAANLLSVDHNDIQGEHRALHALNSGPCFSSSRISIVLQDVHRQPATRHRDCSTRRHSGSVVRARPNISGSKRIFQHISVIPA